MRSKLWALVAVLVAVLLLTGAAGADRGPLVIESGRIMLGNVEEAERPVHIVGTVMGNVLAPAIVVEQSGLVFGNLEAKGRSPGTVIVAGRVVGTVSGQHVTLLPSARVTGNLWSAGQLEIQPGAHHTGVSERPRASTIHIGPFSFDTSSEHDVMYLPRVTRWPTVVVGRSPFGWLPSALGVLALSVLLLAVAPSFVTDLADAATSRPWRCLGIGVLSLLLLVPGLIVLVITIVGILLVPAVLVGYVGLGISGFAGIAWWLGRKLLPDGASPRQLWQLLVGGGLLVLGQQVPVIGGLLALGVTLVGLGAAFTVLADRWRRRRTRGSEPKPELPTESEPKS